MTEGSPENKMEHKEEAETSPLKRVQNARVALERLKNFGVAIRDAGKLEIITRYAEQHPEAVTIEANFRRFEVAAKLVEDGKGDVRLDIPVSAISYLRGDGELSFNGFIDKTINIIEGSLGPEEFKKLQEGIES